MSETKKQHFLPYTYLKYFKTLRSQAGRSKATIYRDDGTTVVEELVKNQCYKNWCYRKTNTRASEEAFGKFEADWSTCVNNIRAGKSEDSLLFVQMLLYHFRNISIQHLNTRDRFEAVSYACFNWIEQKMFKFEGGKRFTDDPKHVTEFPWQVKRIAIQSLILTSDNPSVLTINPERDGTYAPFLLPISPTELLVAIDPTKYEFTNTTGGESDAFLVNGYVAAQSIRNIFYHEPMPEKFRTNLWEFIDRNRQSYSGRGKFEDNRFTPGHALYADNDRNHFTFLKRL